jgi:hypothetical protein
MADSSYCGAYFIINSKISSVVITLLYPFLINPCISFLSLDHRGIQIFITIGVSYSRPKRMLIQFA